MAESKENLKREITVWGLSANLINIMIGAGIFVLPAFVAAGIGNAAVLAYLLCGLLISLVMLCFAEAGSRITVTGGAYAYIERAFGPYAGFLSANFFLFSALFADAAVSNAIADILKTFFPVFESGVVRILFLAILFGGLVAINVVGIKQGIGLVKLIIVVKLLPIIALIIFGWGSVDSANLRWEGAPGVRELTEMSLLLFFAFQGAESGLTVSGEVKNPRRTVPRAILIAISGALIIYLLLQLIAQGVLGAELGTFSEGPLAEAAGRIFGPAGFLVLTFAAAISMFGNLSSEILSLPRLLYSAARDGIIPPKKLAGIHPRFKTPYISIIAYGTTGFLLACIGQFGILAIMSSTYIILLYLGVVLSVFRLRKTVPASKETFVIPGGFIVPAAAIVVMVALLAGLKPEELGAGVLSVVILSLIYLVTLRAKQKQNRENPPE